MMWVVVVDAVCIFVVVKKKKKLNAVFEFPSQCFFFCHLAWSHHFTRGNSRY